MASWYPINCNECGGSDESMGRSTECWQICVSPHLHLDHGSFYEESAKRNSNRNPHGKAWCHSEVQISPEHNMMSIKDISRRCSMEQVSTILNNAEASRGVLSDEKIFELQVWHKISLYQLSL